MSELEEKIAEVINKAKNKCFIGCQGMPEHYCEDVCGIEDAKKILSLIQIEVDCKDCIEGLSNPGWNVKCEICKGTGKITKTPESGDRGEIL